MFRAKSRPSDRPLAALILGLLMLGMLSTVIYKRHIVADVVMEHVTPPALVIRPGRIVTERGELLGFSGFDACAGQAADLPGDCVALPIERTHVPVSVELSGGPVLETWQIVRDAHMRPGWGAIQLRRPDGSAVTFEDVRP
jgi:hypothetical protein